MSAAKSRFIGGVRNDRFASLQIHHRRFAKRLGRKALSRSDSNGIRRSRRGTPFTCVPVQKPCATLDRAAVGPDTDRFLGRWHAVNPLSLLAKSARPNTPPRLWQPAGNFVFFAQQSFEKRSTPLCEGPFFIAWRERIGNFMRATEGGIPMSRYPVTDRT